MRLLVRKDSSVGFSMDSGVHLRGEGSISDSRGGAGAASGRSSLVQNFHHHP
jgi:hypothetical protein